MAPTMREGHPTNPARRHSGPLRRFLHHAIANLVGVVLAMVPPLVVDAMYVRGGQQYDSAWNSDAAVFTAVSVGVLVLFAANWIAARYLRPALRFAASIGLTIVVAALAAVPAVLVLWSFHLAIGGSE